MSRSRFARIVLAGFLLAQWACVAAQDTDRNHPPDATQSQAGSTPTERVLAPVITSAGRRDSLTPAARRLVTEAAGGRICTRLYLSQTVDPNREFRFDEASVRGHIARNAPSRQEGCLFVVDLEGEYFTALRGNDKALINKTVDLYVQAIRTAREARPGEPVIVYGIPNRNWTDADLAKCAPIFARVDYINVNAYAGIDKTEARYRARIDANVDISRKIADEYGVGLIAHVNPRYKDATLVPMDEFIKGMEYLKSKGVEHVVYWQPPWNRVSSLAEEGKPAGMSDAMWQSAVESCYICALLKVFDPESPVSKTCSTKLPVQPR